MFKKESKYSDTIVFLTKLIDRKYAIFPDPPTCIPFYEKHFIERKLRNEAAKSLNESRMNRSMRQAKYEEQKRRIEYLANANSTTSAKMRQNIALVKRMKT